MVKYNLSTTMDGNALCNKIWETKEDFHPRTLKRAEDEKNILAGEGAKQAIGEETACTAERNRARGHIAWRFQQ